jgi:hypothetical protein
MTKQRGEFTATLTTKIYPSSPEEYWLGEVRREDGPTIYANSRPKKSKTEEEMRIEIKTGREKSLRKDSNIQKREQNAREAEAQLEYYRDRYGENDRNRPRTLD